MRSGRLHISGFKHRLQIPLAVKLRRLPPLTIIWPSLDADLDMRLEIINLSRPASKRRGHLGQDLAFTSETRTPVSRHLRAILRADYGMICRQPTSTPVFFGQAMTTRSSAASPTRIIRPAPPIANSVMSRRIERDVIKADQSSRSNKSQTSDPPAIWCGLQPQAETSGEIKGSLFFTFPWEGSSAEEGIRKVQRGQFWK